MAKLPNNVSESVRRLNPQLYGPTPDRLPSSAKPEQTVCHDTLGPPPGKESHPGRCVVRVVSFRRRLLDPDNLCPKYFVDALRYEGLIQNDRLDDIELQTAQVKVSKRREEHTEIEVSTISRPDVVFQQADGAAGVSPAAS